MMRWAVAAVLIAVVYIALRIAGAPASDLFALGAAGFGCAMVALYRFADLADHSYEESPLDDER